MSLDDEAATTPQHLDITNQINGFVGKSFKRSGSAIINVLFNPFYSFRWQSGSGGTIINEVIRPAQLTDYSLGNDVLTIGTKAGTMSDFGPITVTGGVGPDSVILDDSGESRLQTYTVSAAAGHEMFATRGTTVDLGPDIETFEVKGGKGGNIIDVSGTIADTDTIIHTGAGLNTVTDGGSADSLDAILGPVTIDGARGTNSLTFNDQDTKTQENYTLAADQLTRVAADGFTNDMAPISLAGIAAITLNTGSGGSTGAVTGTSAGSIVTVNGNPVAQNQFLVDASADAIRGTVFLNGGNGNTDFAQYVDSGNASPHTYTLTSTSVKRDGQAPVFLSGVFGTIVYASMVGGNTVNVNSVALGASYKIQAANHDHVTVGSLAPSLGGTLADILDQVNVVSYTANDAVTLVLDDSGNTDSTTAKHITFGTDGDGNIAESGLTPIALSWRLPAASSVTIKGGAADAIFSMQSLVAATPLTIVGGTGSNTLDYSSYTTNVSVNLQRGTATDLASIRNPKTGKVTIQNVIGGSGNDTLITGTDKSILIGDGGADHLLAGPGEAILIGGTTDYTQPSLDTTALDRIFQEWGRTDLGFMDRVSDLMTGSNSEGLALKNTVAGMAILLNSTTVHDDLAIDVLTGGTGPDWYFIAANDLITNKKSGDKVT